MSMPPNLRNIALCTVVFAGVLGGASNAIAWESAETYSHTSTLAPAMPDRSYLYGGSFGRAENVNDFFFSWARTLRTQMNNGGLNFMVDFTHRLHGGIDGHGLQPDLSPGPLVAQTANFARIVCSSGV